MTFHRLVRFPVFFFATTLLLSAPCHADNESPLSSLSLSPDFYDSLIQNVSTQTLAATRRSVLGKTGPTPLSKTRRDGVTETLAANLTYHPSIGISRTLRKQIADEVAVSDPDQSPQIKSALTNDAPWQWFDRLLSRAGFSARNLADVTATYYVSAWEIIHQTDASPAESRAARDQITRSLKNSPEVMFMSDAEKQRSAETFGILTAVSISGSQSLIENNDATGYALLQYRIHQSFLQQGVDLKRLVLDRDGFVSG